MRKVVIEYDEVFDALERNTIRYTHTHGNWYLIDLEDGKQTYTLNDGTHLIMRGTELTTSENAEKDTQALERYIDFVDELRRRKLKREGWPDIRISKIRAMPGGY